MSRITPAGSITFLPKIHDPVSTMMKLLPISFVASSTLPMSPSVASTLKPDRSRLGGVWTVNVHISTVAMLHLLEARWPRSLGYRLPLDAGAKREKHANLQG